VSRLQLPEQPWSSGHNGNEPHRVLDQAVPSGRQPHRPPQPSEAPQALPVQSGVQQVPLKQVWVALRPPHSQFPSQPSLTWPHLPAQAWSFGVLVQPQTLAVSPPPQVLGARQASPQRLQLVSVPDSVSQPSALVSPLQSAKPGGRRPPDTSPTAGRRRIVGAAGSAAVAAVVRIAGEVGLAAIALVVVTVGKAGISGKGAAPATADRVVGVSRAGAGRVATVTVTQIGLRVDALLAAQRRAASCGRSRDRSISRLILMI
jgi:hypothetical protein